MIGLFTKWHHENVTIIPIILLDYLCSPWSKDYNLLQYYVNYIYIVLVKADYFCIWQFYHNSHGFIFPPLGEVAGRKMGLVIIILREYNLSRFFWKESLLFELISTIQIPLTKGRKSWTGQTLAYLSFFFFFQCQAPMLILTSLEKSLEAAVLPRQMIMCGLEFWSRFNPWPHSRQVSYALETMTFSWSRYWDIQQQCPKERSVQL